MLKNEKTIKLTVNTGQMEEMFKEKMLKTMWTSQVYGHTDKMARTKHTEHYKTRRIQ